MYLNLFFLNKTKMKRRSINRGLTAHAFSLIRHLNLINKMEYIYAMQCRDCRYAGLVRGRSTEWSKFKKHVSCVLLKAHSPNELLNESHTQAPTAAEASVLKRKMTICWTSARIFFIYYYMYLFVVFAMYRFYFYLLRFYFYKMMRAHEDGRMKNKNEF